MLIIDHKEQPLVSWRPGNQTMRHCSQALGAEHLTTGEQWFEPGTGAPQHSHPEGVEEVIVILEGSATFKVDGEEVVVGAGQSIILPPLSHHGFVANEPFHIGGGGLSKRGPDHRVRRGARPDLRHRRHRRRQARRAPPPADGALKDPPEDPDRRSPGELPAVRRAPSGRD